MSRTALAGAIRPRNYPSYLGVAIIGAGRWGQQHARALMGLPGARLVALCDTAPECLTSALSVVEQASTLGEAEMPLLSESVAEVLGYPEVDAVIIATPPGSHAELVCRALEANKDVLVEKPLCTSVREAERLRAAERRSGARVMTGHLLRYHPAIVRLKQLVSQGRLGPLTKVVCRRDGRSPAVSAGRGGSAFWDSAWWALGPHDLSVVRYLLGAEPLRLRARSSAVGVRAEDAVAVELDFGGAARGVEVELFVDGGSERKVRRMELFGSHASAVFEDGPEARLSLLPRCGGEQSWDYSGCEPLASELRHFVSSVASGERFDTDLADGARVVRILEAASHSLIRGSSWLELV